MKNKINRSEEMKGYFSFSWKGDAFLRWNAVVWMKSASAESFCTPKLWEGTYSEKQVISLGVKKLSVFLVRHFWLQASMNFLSKDVSIWSPESIYQGDYFLILSFIGPKNHIT